MIDYLRLKYNMDYIKECLDIVLESKDEGKLRYTKSNDDYMYDANVTPNHLKIVRAVDNLNKKYKNNKIDKDQYKAQLKKLDKTARKIDPLFDYVSNSDHGKAYDDIPDKRPVMNRHDRKRLGLEKLKGNTNKKYFNANSNSNTSYKPLKADNDDDKRAKRLVKRLVSSDNLHGINKRSQGEHDTTFRQLAKQTGHGEMPIYINRDDKHGRLEINRVGSPDDKEKKHKKVPNPNDFIHRVSASKNATMGRPSNKSTDGIIYSTSGLYFGNNIKNAESQAPVDKAHYPYVLDKSKSKKQNEVFFDPESENKTAAFMKTRDKQHFSKYDKIW